MSSSILLFWILSIMFLTVSLFFVSFIIFYNQKVLKKNAAIRELEEGRKRELVKNTLEIQEKERARIGADLHDDLGPMLSTIKMHINQLSYKDEENKNLKTVGTYLDKTISDMRNLSKNLFPSILKEFGLKDALIDLQDRINSANTIQIHLNFPDKMKKLDENVELSIYRICQEFVNNSIKHSKAEKITINFNEIDGKIKLAISDNGVGFDQARLGKEKGIGLRSMELRARAINADFSFYGKPSEGTHLELLYTPLNLSTNDQIRHTG